MPQSAESPKAAGMFVAVGQNGQRTVSPDGVNWSTPQAGKEGEVYRAVCFGNGRFVAIGSFGGDNIFATTTDGTTWETSKQDAHYSTYVRGIGYGAGKFIALGGDPGSVGLSKPFVLSSADGRHWSEPKPISGKNILRRIAFGKDIFVGVGDRGRRSVSPDALEWKDAPDAKAIDTLIDVAFGAGVFVGVGLNGLRMTTEDGLTWSNRQLGEEGEHINSVLWAADQFVGVGMGGTYFSPDGAHWKRVENHNAPLFAAWGSGGFVGSRWKGRILFSQDAIEWKEVFKAEAHVEAIAWGELARR